MSETKTTTDLVSDGTELQRRLLAGETLHHGQAPGQDQPSYWLRPSMAPASDGAVLAWRKATPRVR